MPSYELTKSADSDLEDIVRYTIKNWGEQQTRFYLEKLHSCFQKIGNNEVIGRVFSERFPQARVTRCEHHYVFYLILEDRSSDPNVENPPRIFAVLHERMDMLARLKERLG